jgi:predicted O-linked N-acetylglucosamine transferase (SPINDLY family)
MGASLLTQAGMTSWIAESVDDYVEIALALAADPAKLHELRRGLRRLPLNVARMVQSTADQIASRGN